MATTETCGIMPLTDTRFIDSPFPTKAEYESYLKMSPAEATHAWQRTSTPPIGPAALVGRTVEIYGLAKRPELNGRRGRVLSYSEETGRFGLLLKSLQAFGSVEKTRIALLPANVRATAMDDEAPSTAATGTEPEPPDAVTWRRLLEALGMPHLKQIHWSSLEEKLTDHLMKKPPESEAAVELLAKAGVGTADERARIVEALNGPPTMFDGSASSGLSSGLSTILKLFAARMERSSARDKAHVERMAQAQTQENRGVPKADAKFRVSDGRVCDQRHGKIDDDVARPPLQTSAMPSATPGEKKGRAPRITVYPSSSQADEIAGLLRMRVRLTACFGNDAHVFEGMLERRGVSLLAVEFDTLKDADDYYERRIYCSEVRRVGINCLLRLPDPANTALVFVNGQLWEWEAYLARYPEVPLVLVIGDDESDVKMHKPRPSQLMGFRGLRLLRRMPVCSEPSRSHRLRSARLPHRTFGSMAATRATPPSHCALMPYLHAGAP